ncbi:MAG: YbjN domain-containing protein [Clostridiales bacterium]|nr:YbjN domain-containing protein [Clostridiales bacterium]
MKERIYSKPIANAIKDFLTEDDWRFSFDEQRGMIRFNLSIKGKIKKINYFIDVTKDEFTTYAVSPLGADENDKEMMAAMAEFVCRANYGLSNGNFELDMRDGEIRYKCFVDCEGLLPTREMIRNSIYCPAAMFERYSAGIVDVIFKQATAKEAVDRCEDPAESGLRSLLSDMVDDEDGGEFGDLLARLAERLGISEGEGEEAEEEADAEEPTQIKTDLFGTEGEDD